jgi:hypothetical protein
MSNVPSDLVKLGDIIKEYKPSRSWWDAQIAAGRIHAYKMPGERGLLVSESEVRAFMQPKPHDRADDEDAG